MFVQQRLYNLQQQGSLERLPNQIQPPNADHGHQSHHIYHHYQSRYSLSLHMLVYMELVHKLQL
jgi:hypothetical protein